MSKIELTGRDFRGATFVLVPHDHKQFPMKAEVLERGIHRVLISVDTSEMRGACSLVMIDAIGQRHVLGSGEVNVSN